MQRIGRLGGILGHSFGFGMRKIIPPVEQGRLAKYDPFAAGFKFILNPIYSLEPQQFNRTGIIAQSHDQPRTSALPDKLHIRNLSANLKVNIFGINLTYRRKPAAIHMPERVIGDQVVICADTRFFPKQFSPLGANSFQEFYRCLQEIN